MSGSRLYAKILLAMALVAWAAWNWRQPERLIPFRLGKLEGGMEWLPFSLSLIFLSLYTGLGLVLYANFSNYSLGDIGAYLSAFNNSRGWLPGLNNWTGLPHLAHHSEFLCIPLGWLFKAAPYPATIQLVQAACSFLAWILFRSWVLKRGGDKAAGEWLAFGFALTACLLAPLLKGFHGAGMAMPAMVATATAFHDRNFRKFLIALTVLLLTKETYTLTAMSLGVLALVQRREGKGASKCASKWAWVPFAMGLGYGLFLRFGFFPMMLGDRQYFYDYMRPGPAEMLRNLLSGSALLYAGIMALWGGFVQAFRSPYALLALPPALLNVALGQGFDRPTSHYSMEVIFWIFFAGATRLQAGKPDGATLYSFLASLLLMNTTLVQNAPFYLKHQHADSYRQVLDRLPPDAIVALAVPIDDQAWKIHRYYLVKYNGYGPVRPCTWSRLFGLEGKPGEYAVLHRGVGMFNFAPQEKEHVRHCWEELKQDPAYRTVWEDSVLTLIEKKD